MINAGSSNNHLHYVFRQVLFGQHQSLQNYLSRYEDELDINGRDEKGATPLIRCVQAGLEAEEEKMENLRICMQVLVQHGADLEIADNLGRTALHWAAVVKSPALSSDLLKLGADPTVQEEKGRNALHLAIHMSCIPCVQEIITADNEVSEILKNLHANSSY